MSQPNNIAADDPRLTAYALGAMEPDEASAFEALLENDADARAEVEAIRALAGDLEGEFADLPRDEGLDDARREAVLAGGADAVAAASTPNSLTMSEVRDRTFTIGLRPVQSHVVSSSQLADRMV